MAALTLCLLGPPLTRAGESDVRLPALKAQALLYYLAAQPGRPFARPQLCALLWEDKAEAEGRNSLSTVLTRLRQGLPVFPVAAEGDTLTWRPGDAAWVDTDALSAAGSTLADLRAAADLWRGPFLDGFAVRDSLGYDEWLTQMRAVWEGRYLDVLWRLADAAHAAHDWSLVQDTAQRALSVDPFQERFYRSLMAALYQAGDRAAALVQYDECARILQRDLGITPDPETVMLSESIRDGQLTRITPRSASRPPVPPRALRAPTLPLIERQAALDSLLKRLNSGKRHECHSQLVIVKGEAGIGKTRLLTEVVWRLSQEDPPSWTTLEGHCYEAERSLPYHPFVDALRPVLAQIDIATLPVPDVWLSEVARLLPDLAGMRSGLVTPARLDAAQEQRRLFEGVARFLAALPLPLVLILDDLQWADAGTLQLLAYLVRHLASESILFIAAVRSEDADESLTTLLWRLEREGRLATITLDRLSPAGTAWLAREVAPMVKATLASRPKKLAGWR